MKSKRYKNLLKEKKDLSSKSIKDLLSFTEKFFINTKKKFPKNFIIFNKLFNKKNIARKECLLLPFKTLSKALKDYDE